MSCSNTNTCTASCASCKCCHVQSVTINDQLCVGNETVLRTCGADGGALVVQNGCCEQTSGNLVHIRGEVGQVALNVESGKISADVNEDLADDSAGVAIANSTQQTNGQLVKITGATNQTALAVLDGETQLVSNSSIGNSLYVGNQAEQTDDELLLVDGTLGGQSGGTLLKVEGVLDQRALCVQNGQTVLDPNSADGGALTVSNSASQTTGELVSINGNAGTTALLVSEGTTVLDPNASDGGALLVSNTDTQTSGSLVTINGETNQTALSVSAGLVVFQDGLDDTAIGSSTPAPGAFTTLSASSGLDDTAIGSTTPASASFTTVHIDPSNDAGSALTIQNSSTQTSGNLVEIEGDQGQTAVHVSDGGVVIESSKTDRRAESAVAFIDAVAGLKVRGGLAVDGTDDGGENQATLDVSGTPTVYAGGIVSGGMAVGGSLWTTTSIANETATEKKAGLLVGGGAIVEKNLILVPDPVNAPAPSSSADTAGAAGEIRVSGNYMYLYTGSEWRRVEFSAF